MINIRELGSVKLGVLTSFLLGFLVAITAGHTGLAFAQSRNNVDMNSIVPTLMMLLEEPDGESEPPTTNGIPIISRLNLIGYNDGDSNAVNLGQLRDGHVINLASLTVDEINIEAVSATTSLSESVSFTLSGADVFTRTDNDMTFTLKDSRDRFDLSESELSEGVYNLTVTAYNDINGAGIAGDAYTISFTVVDPRLDPARPSLSSFDLIGVDTNGRVTTIKSINNFETINLSSISSPKINFYAVPTQGDIVKSVHFLLTGPLTLDRVENVAPYSLAFDGNHLDIENDGLPVGDYSLVITPYSDRNRQGDAGNVLTLSFSVEEGDTQPTPDVANLAGVDLFGDNNRVIRRLTDGASIDLRLITSSTVSFSAVPSQNSQTESVSLSLIGPVTLNQTLNAPQLTTQAFNVAADELPAGLYNLQLTPYTGRDASGDAGDLVTIEFRVIRSNDSEPTPPLAGIPEVVLSYPSGIHEPGKLLYRNVGLGRITNIIYHNGVVYTHNVAAGNRREWRWSNKNDINSFGIVKEGTDVPAPTDHGTHGYNKIGDWVAGTYGPLIQRVSPGVNASPFLGGESHPDWVGTPDDTQIYWPWSLPFSWIQYDGDDNTGSFIRRFDKELARWDSLEDHGVTGNTILIGNILLVTSDETANGILSYDISPIFETPSRPPVLLDKLGGNIGAYIAVPWRNYIIMARRDSQSIDVVDYSDPTNLRFVTSISTTTDPDKNAGGNVPYTQAQDEFIFAMRHKINMETFEKVLELDEVGGKRPAGSESGPLGTSQFLLPVGQYLLTGAYSSGGRDGMGIWAHQREPDTRGPFVGYHIPRQGQKNYPTQAPISVLIHETLESYTIVNGQTVIVRPVGGEPVEAYVSFSYTDVLTITPKEPLLENTSYEVVFPEGGIRDAANNGMQAYSFSFSTGDSVLAGNRSPDISAVIASKDSPEVGDTVTYRIAASDAENDPLEYRFSFTNGIAGQEWSVSDSVSRTFPKVGRHELVVQVRDKKPSGASSQVADSQTISVTATIDNNQRPSKSSAIAIDALNNYVWTVNPDNNSLTQLAQSSNTLVQEIALDTLSEAQRCLDPRSITVVGTQLWLACHDSDRILVLSLNGAVVRVIDTGYGSAPIAITSTPDNVSVLVTLEGRGASDAQNGQLIRFNATSMEEQDRLELGPMPRAIAVTGNSNRALVTRFISPENNGEVWDVDLSGVLKLNRTILLARDRGDRGQDGPSSGAGVPNYLSAISITPDNRFAWVAAKKDQTQLGGFFKRHTDTHPEFSGDLSHDHSVRAMVVRIDLATNQEPNSTTDKPKLSSRLDIDNSDSPSAVDFSPRGDYAYITLQGNNEVAVYDVLGIRSGFNNATAWRISVGNAPQAVLSDHQNGDLWVKNFLDRSVSKYQLASFLSQGTRDQASIVESTVTAEALNDNVINGKRTFYRASDQMSLENYMSCATCHIDGMHDGRVFDFTQRGEGLRNTTDLRGRSGTGHGRVHWSGNFDEIQDFALDIENHFGGTGFLAEGELPHPSLGQANAGRSVVLDDLSAYLESLNNESLPKSPYRDESGSLSSDALAGSALFQQQNCASCHSGSTFTDSSLTSDVLHNVGTLRSSSGQRLNGVLRGIDTPTLLGVWASGPYLHDGQAANLGDVFSVAGGTIYQAEMGVLSNGAQVNNYQDINNDGEGHGALVSMVGTNQTVTFEGIDGGQGGVGALEFRYRSDGAAGFQVNVNGIVHTVSIDRPSLNRQMRRARIENITLRSGIDNSISLIRTSGRIAMDEMTVSRPDELLAADAHRRVLNLSSIQQRQIKRYLLELDGR